MCIDWLSCRTGALVEFWENLVLGFLCYLGTCEKHWAQTKKRKMGGSSLLLYLSLLLLRTFCSVQFLTDYNTGTPKPDFSQTSHACLFCWPLVGLRAFKVNFLIFTYSISHTFKYAKYMFFMKAAVFFCLYFLKKSPVY